LTLAWAFCLVAPSALLARAGEAIARAERLPKPAPRSAARREQLATCRVRLIGSPKEATACPEARKKTSACRVQSAPAD
jgi:hypothetical protein